MQFKAEKTLRRKLSSVDIWRILAHINESYMSIAGEAGVGKSSSMAILASDWAEGSTESNLSQFHFIFLILLRHVNDNSTLEQIVIKQHGLRAKNIPESHIKSILYGLVNCKVLLLLDGYDEYKKGTNEYIDTAIEDTIGDMFLILTSRDGDYISKGTLAKMDGEIEITGLSKQNIVKCATKYLESKEEAEDLIGKCHQTGIFDLLHIPIILLMGVVLYHKTKELPTSLTELVQSIIIMCMDRSTLKHFGTKVKDIDGLEDLLHELGEISLNSLKRDRLLLSKVIYNILVLFCMIFYTPYFCP